MLVTIATVFVVVVNLMLAAGLLAAAVLVWRSRLPLRRFARDIDALELELRATLPPLPEQLTEGGAQLRDLNNRHQLAIARLEMAQKAIAIARKIWGRWRVWRRSGR